MQTQKTTGEIGIYSCGPTVYDHVHIGNLISFIWADILRRAIATQPSASVNHVMNLTDVDDKTITKSTEMYPNLDDRLQALQKTTQYFEQSFLEDMKSVGNNIEAMTFVRATESIDDMKVLITTLFNAGIAYVADDGVYFSIKKFRDSGKTYGQLTNITAQSTGASRVDNDEYDKDNIHDFALWKSAKPHEPTWDLTLDSTTISGRPGWHIECSAMATTALGQPFSIHTGGIDLTFPHHENEIAQSTAAVNTDRFAELFFHNEHLLVDGQKMSKSLGNFYTLKDIAAKGYEPIALRVLTLQSSYRHQLNFTWKSLAAAQQYLHRLLELNDYVHQTFSAATTIDFKSAFEKIQSCLLNDLHTAEALATLSGVVDSIRDDGIHTDQKDELTHFIKQVEDLLGIGLNADTDDIADDMKELIHKRQQARAQANYKLADELRDQLQTHDIIVNDTALGTTWTRQR